MKLIAGIGYLSQVTNVEPPIGAICINIDVEVRYDYAVGPELLTFGWSF